MNFIADLTENRRVAGARRWAFSHVSYVSSAVQVQIIPRSCREFQVPSIGGVVTFRWKLERMRPSLKCCSVMTLHEQIMIIKVLSVMCEIAEGTNDFI